MIRPRVRPQAQRRVTMPLREASFEFHAWGDSNLYLRRNRDPRENGDITLTVEHRAAPAMPGVTLELAQREDALALEVIDREPRRRRLPVPSTSASLPHSPTSTARCHSLSCARAAASAPPPSTSASPPLPPPAASASPTKVIASPVADRARATISREHSHNRRRDIAPTARFRFQLSLQRGGSGSGKSIKMVCAAPRARRAILLFDRRHPSVPTCARDMPARAAAVKDGPSSGHRASGAKRP